MAETCVETERLSLEVIQTTSEVGVTLLGRAEGIEQARTIEPVFGQVLDDAQGSQRTVKLHCEGIKHLNSATLVQVMGFLVRAEDAGVRVVVTYDADVDWQRLSFRAIQRMGLRSDLLEVHGL